MTDPDPDNMVGAAVYLEDRARGDDDRHIAALLRRAQERAHRLELSLRNCLALACQKRSKDPDAWGHVIRFCREADIEPSILREAEAAVTPGALSEAMRHAATLLQSKGLAPKTVVVDLVRHLGALRKCVERTRTLDDCGAESGSSWQSPDLESNIEAADKALAFFFDLFGVPLEAK